MSINQLGQRPANIESFSRRLEKHTDNQNDHTLNSQDLCRFLDESIAFLSKGDNYTNAENIAHYLMGKVDYLPEGFEGTAVTLPRETRSLLHDLLRTHRFGFLGTREAPEKTIAKLQKLSETVRASIDAEQATSASSDLTPVQSNQLASSIEPARQNRSQLCRQFLDQLPKSMTDHPNWGQVKQRMEMYLTHTGHIQGKSFEALLSYAIKNSSVADLVGSFQYQGALSNENKQMALQRELWNVTMMAAAADENKAALGCERSYANERAKDSQASIPDCLLPGNQLSVTMKTPLQKKNLEIVNITVISCTAPALDTGLQPEFKAYVFGGNQLQEQKLDEQAYRKSFDCIKNQVLAAAKAHPEANRVALPAIGMNAFLTGLTEQNKKTAIKIGSETLAELAIELRDIGKEVLITDLSNHGIVWQQVNNFLESRKQDPLAFGGPIPGDWITEGMMVLNAWDPHSLVGNGLSNDDSIDGYLGRSTLTHLIHALHCAAYAENIPLDFNPVGS